MTDWKDQMRQRDEARRTAVIELPTVAVSRYARVTPAVPGDVPVSASVGPAGELVVLWSAAVDEPALRSSTTQPGWATFPDPQAQRPVRARMTRHGRELLTVTPLPDLTLAHPMVQPLPDGRVLVVGARCRWRPSGPDRNAVVYDADGTVVAQETLGDGIEHVFATGTGEVWVGYFDEGVYGNYGWGDADSAPPIGSNGLVRFSADLQPVWRYPFDGEWDAISDCYALNVTDDEGWACYYTDFPVVRVRDDTVAGWRNDVSGARALAVSGTRTALLGGYGPEHDRLTVGELEDDRVRVLGAYRLVLPDGSALPTDATVIGRGSVLHLVTGEDWYQLPLDQVGGGDRQMF